MRLEPMTEEEFQSWQVRSRAAYAADKMRANGFTREEAERIAEEDFRRYLPEGLRSPDSHLYSFKNAGGAVLGFIWYGVRGAANNRRAFILDVIIEEEHRGRGLGRKMMELLEEKIREQGLGRVGLHVFGYNEPAIRLYRSLGYATTDLVMEKEL